MNRYFAIPNPQRLALFVLLLAATVAAPLLLPGPGPSGRAAAVSVGTPAPGGRAIEAVVVRDTTGSMSGLLEGAKRKIWSIADAMGGQRGVPVRIGLVAYRDRGDAFVTRPFDFTPDMDAVYAELLS